jgi:hypothetical protein
MVAAAGAQSLLTGSRDFCLGQSPAGSGLVPAITTGCLVTFT